MALLPIGSDKLLEIKTSIVHLVIKSKMRKTASVVTEDRSSSLAVTASSLKNIRVFPQNFEVSSDDEGISFRSIAIAPLFFEQTDYELLISSVNGEKLQFWNENYLLRDKISPVVDERQDLLSGIINFGSSVGYSDFEILADGREVLKIRIEVFPSKISYKEDYQKMIADVSEMVYAAAIDFMQRTYQNFSIDKYQNSVPAIFFQIISRVFNKYMSAVNRIINIPHHKLITEYYVVPEHKAKIIDRKSEKWLLNHQKYICNNENGLAVEKVMSVKKQITFDTNENRFVKFILQTTVRKLEDFENRYIKTIQHPEDSVLLACKRMKAEIRRTLVDSFMNEVSDYSATHSMSLVFGMAPGYRELYKYFLMIQRGLSVNGDIFRLSVKETAQLYEYWCFIKLFSLLKKEYKLLTPDIIKVENSGVTVALVKGKRSKAVFINPKTGEQIALVYNPGEADTQTVNQKPDNVLELEKTGTDVSYKYVFDAKYRIEMDPSSNFYPDSNPGPKVEDINTMHRYRDSIVYENKVSKFTFEKTMFGAYILFPYDQEELYKQHRFYRSIDSVNIGGLPFLPGATNLVQKLLNELIADSKESAFERTTLPRGIEEKLARIDWERRDVLIGTFRSVKQFDICLDKKFYYIPAKQISEDHLPIHYVALYQTQKKFGAQAGIQYYGEVITTELVHRSAIKDVPMTRNNGDELYYRFSIRVWRTLPKPIRPKETGFVFEYTNMFLLTHSEYVPELLIEDEATYRFYYELKRNANSTEINEGNRVTAFDYENVRFEFASGRILAMRDGKIIENRLVSDFVRRPAAVFRSLQEAVNRG